MRRLRRIAAAGLGAADFVNRLRFAAERLVTPRPRVLATACWSFPIYSQAFVYQEVLAMRAAGFAIRFLYTHADGRDRLPQHCDALWAARRRDLLHRRTGRTALAEYRRRWPARVEALVDRIAAASGMGVARLLDEQHLLEAFAFTRVVEAIRPDYLHSYFFYERSFFALVAGALLGIPRGISCYADHELDDYPFKLLPLHLETCAIVVATSARIRDELLARAPAADPTRILVKPNAIDATRFPATARPPGGPHDPPRLLAVSRLEPKKGLLDLVDAVAILRDEAIEVHLDIAGEPDAGNAASEAYAAALRARIAGQRLEDRVRLLGRLGQPAVVAALRATDVFVAPSVELDNGDKDGMPTSLMEAMATGAPVVATRAGSITEIVTHETDGLLVAQRDPAALAGAVRRLLGDPALRARLGAAAAATIRQRLDVSVCEDALHERIRSAIGAATRVRGTP